MRVGLVLVAAGAGSRMVSAEKKQFALLGGAPVLVRALTPFLGLPGLARVAAVLPGDDLARGRLALAGVARNAVDLEVLAGGATRQESARRGVEALHDSEVLLVHDGARPLVSEALARRVLEAASAGEAAVPVVPVADTLKRLVSGGIETVSRDDLRGAQTPQGFPRAMILEAHRRAARDAVTATDDAALCERCGFPVRLVAGEAENLKITTAADLRVAEALLAVREGASGPNTAAGGIRTGIGYDVHRLEGGRPCVLGGVRIEAAAGPVGYSDADVLVHAIMDALLGAAGEPDIGQRFPPGDPRFARADSLALLVRVRESVATRYEILFVDSLVVAERPRVAPHVPEMRARLAAALDLDPGRVNVKATTAEGLGAVGRGEGIAAQAVATLRERA